MRITLWSPACAGMTMAGGLFLAEVDGEELGVAPDEDVAVGECGV